jgi:glutathione S-transferase
MRRAIKVGYSATHLEAAAMVKLYGTSKSRSARSLWALEELGVKFEHVATEVPKAKGPENLKLNPNGHIPVLEDDGFILYESMAINLYLAEKYGKNSIWPASVEDHGRSYQWSFWAITELESHLLTLLMHKVFLPSDQRDEKKATDAINTLKAPLGVLETALKGHEYLLGNHFTIADLNVAAVLVFGTYVKFDHSATPAVHTWLQKCFERESFKKLRSLA